MWSDPLSPIRSELGPGEALLWSGRPQQGIMLRPADVYLIPFSLLWTGFAVFWTASVAASTAPSFFVLWGIPFVLLGLYLTFGRFVVDVMQRDRTYYGVTGRRIVIASGLVTRGVKSLDLLSLGGVSLDQKRDGRGTITFGSGPTQWSWFNGTGWPGAPQAPRFDTIPDARHVFEVIQKAQQEALRSRV